MLRFFLFGMLLLSFCSRADAQKIGDSQEAVRAVLGQPQMSRGSAGSQVWLYGGGARVTFKDGVVVAMEGLQPSEPSETAQPLPPTPAVRESVTVVPAAKPPPRAVVEEVDVPEDEPESASERGATAPRWKFGVLVLAFLVVTVVCLVCQVMILIKAFQTSIWWGLGSLFVPFVVLIFVVSNWSEVKKPFLVNLAAAGVIPLAVFLM